MTRLANGIAAIVISIFGCCGLLRAYDDDDLLCRPGWSPELLQQQLWQQDFDQRAAYAHQQYAMTHGAAAEQKSFERIKSARRARFDRLARQKEELIAKRRSQTSPKNVSNPARIKAASEVSTVKR